MINRVLNIIILFFALQYCKAQVTVTDSITLNNIDASKRQVENLGLPNLKSNAVNVFTYQSNYLLFGNILGGTDTLTLKFPVKYEKYYTGMVIYFLALNNNNGSLFVNVDSLGTKEIKVYNRSLNPNEIIANRIIRLMYNGNNFDLQSEPSSPCPNGFTSVNQKFCIEIDERDSLSFYDANIVCGDMNARLCTWSEWKYACDNNGALLNIIGNYEWIDDAENYTGGFIGAKVSGGTSCTDNLSQNTSTTNIRKYRCCYTR